MLGRALLIISALSLCAGQVLAGTTTYGNSYMYSAPGGGSPQPLGNLVASTVYDLDATIASSYDGTSQTWANYEGTPADSSGQTAYDMYRGTSSSTEATEDPVFNGTSGSSSAYFEQASSKEFRLAGSVTTFLQSLHKQGTGEQSFWIAIAFRYEDWGSIQYLLTTTGSAGSNPNIVVGISNTDKLFLRQRLGSNTDATSTTNLVDGTDYVIIITHDSVGNNTLMYINSMTEESLSHTFAANTTNANGQSMGRFIGQGYAATGTRYYGFSAGNAYIGDTEAQAICDEYELRHARTYC